jgi:ornithine carbamoyltransferase
MRHVLTLLELAPDEINRIFHVTKELKDKLTAGFASRCCRAA